MSAAEVLNLDLGVAILINDLEWPRLHVLLDGRVIEATTNKTPVEKNASRVSDHAEGYDQNRLWREERKLWLLT